MWTVVGLMISITIALAACAAPPPSPPLEPAPDVPVLHNVDYWQSIFDQDAPAVDQASRPLSRSADSWDFYGLAHSIDAFTSMFEATGDSRYADVALDYAEGMMASARSSRALSKSNFGDDYLGWVSQQADVRGQEVALYESYSWRYVARLLRVLRLSPIYDDVAYRGRYDAVLAFAEKNIFEKWYTRSAEDFIYRDRTHMAAHWAYIALDLSRLTASEERRIRYVQVVRAVNDDLPNYSSSLRAQLRPNPRDPAAYIWSDEWGRTDPPQDVSHGNGVISYVVEARDMQGGWSAAEVAGFSRTLTSFILGDNGHYPEYVDGSGKGNGWIADGFVKLGRYDASVQAALEDYGVQNAQYYAAMAVNARLLGVQEDH